MTRGISKVIKVWDLVGFIFMAIFMKIKRTVKSKKR